MPPAEPSPKRLRLSSTAVFDRLPDIDQIHQECRGRLKSTFESIFDKYSHDFSDIGDEIDLRTGTISVDHGHLRGMAHDRDVGPNQVSSRRLHFLSTGLNARDESADELNSEAEVRLLQDSFTATTALLMALDLQNMPGRASNLQSVPTSSKHPVNSVETARDETENSQDESLQKQADSMVPCHPPPQTPQTQTSQQSYFDPFDPNMIQTLSMSIAQAVSSAMATTWANRNSKVASTEPTSRSNVWDAPPLPALDNPPQRRANHVPGFPTPESARLPKPDPGSALSSSPNLPSHEGEPVPTALPELSLWALGDSPNPRRQQRRISSGSAAWRHSSIPHSFYDGIRRRESASGQVNDDLVESSKDDDHCSGQQCNDAKRIAWSDEHTYLLAALVGSGEMSWEEIGQRLGGRSVNSLRCQYFKIKHRPIIPRTDRNSTRVSRSLGVAKLARERTSNTVIPNSQEDLVSSGNLLEQFQPRKGPRSHDGPQKKYRGDPSNSGPVSQPRKTGWSDRKQHEASREKSIGDLPLSSAETYSRPRGRPRKASSMQESAVGDSSPKTKKSPQKGPHSEKSMSGSVMPLSAGEASTPVVPHHILRPKRISRPVVPAHVRKSEEAISEPSKPSPRTQSAPNTASKKRTREYYEVAGEPQPGEPHRQRSSRSKVAKRSEKSLVKATNLVSTVEASAAAKESTKNDDDDSIDELAL